MAHDLRFELHAGRPLAVVRRCAGPQDLPRVVPEACGTVWGVLRGQQTAGMGRNVAVYLDGRINLEVGVEMDAPFAGCGEVVPSATPAGRVVTTTHYGPYGRLGEAHDAIREWCARNGHTPAGPSWEVYGHWQKEWNDDSAKITTEVFYLLAPPASAAAE